VSDSLAELRLGEFLERLGSRAPTPGGGSASALAGASGAALLHMVVELTASRPDVVDDETLAEFRGAAAAWRSELTRLVDVDAAAYDGVIAARRLPRTTEREIEARRVQVAGAVREATRVPLEIARRSFEVLALAERVARIGNRNAISDVGVAALLAAAAVRGAAMNVRINLPALPPDDPLQAEAGGEIEDLLAKLESTEAAVRAAVEDSTG
jgi:methenyltetrahydrofolate cyclohydrolase